MVESERILLQPPCTILTTISVTPERGRAGTAQRRLREMADRQIGRYSYLCMELQERGAWRVFVPGSSELLISGSVVPRHVNITYHSVVRDKQYSLSTKIKSKSLARERDVTSPHRLGLAIDMQCNVYLSSVPYCCF